MDLQAIEMATAVQEQLISSIMAFSTILFAYIVTTHFVGSRLPLRFAVAVTVVYSFALIGPWVGTSVGLYRLGRIAAEHPEIVPRGRIPRITYLPTLIIIAG